MTIDGKEMPFEIEFEIRQMYDRTFDAIIENVKASEKFERTRGCPADGDTFVRITRSGVRIVAVRLAVFKEKGNGGYFRCLVATESMMEFEELYYIDNSFCIVEKECWRKCEVLYNILKNSFEGMMKKYKQ